jgi:hypothetical protein
MHNEEMRDKYPTQSIIKIIKSTSIRLAGHVTRMGKRRELIGYW